MQGESDGESAQEAPLAGIKVIEVGVAMAGPFCGMTLADLGAGIFGVIGVPLAQGIIGTP